MKIFVTGGTGFIGSYVIRDLLKAGYTDIKACKRATSKMDLVSDIQNKVEWVDCSLFDLVQLEDTLKGCDAIIHIAGAVSFAPWKKEEIFKTNIEATSNLVNLAIDQEISRFIHFSSVAALGLSNNTIDEAAVWTENKSKSVYSLSKYLGEREAWRGFAEGLNLSIINPSLVIGASHWYSGPMSIIARLDKGLNYYPVGTTGVVDVRDVAQMTTEVLGNTDISGRRFICSGDNISHLDMMTKMCDALEKPHPTKRLDGMTGRLAWTMSAITSKLKRKDALLTKESYTIASSQLSYDNSQSKRLLNMDYIPVDQSISDVVRCYQQSKRDGKSYAVYP